MIRLAAIATLVLTTGPTVAARASDCDHAKVDGEPLVAFEVRGDAVPEPLGGCTGDPDRGRAVVVDRRSGNCLICHQFPMPDQPFQGEIGPPMAGVGARLSEGQIRLRLIDQSRLNPATLMPPYYRVDGLTNVAPEYRGRPALDAQSLEDVVAYLSTLTGEAP